MSTCEPETGASDRPSIRGGCDADIDYAEEGWRLPDELQSPAVRYPDAAAAAGKADRTPSAVITKSARAAAKAAALTRRLDPQRPREELGR